MSEALPTFRYHPDPVATGAVKASEAECVACGRRRGYIYAGVTYSEDDYDEAFCPWCIADGSAAERFGAEFTDVGDLPDDVPLEVAGAIARHTPGFDAWQGDHWLYHCKDGCAYLGRAGREALAAHPDALDMLVHEHDEYGGTEEESLQYADQLRVDGDSTAYLFQCLSCGAYLAYTDSN